MNNFYNGGAKDVSDTFAAALWGLDLMHWWAVHGARGINFHTGDAVAAGQAITVCKYAAYLSAADGYLTRPLGYAIKAFDLTGHGLIVPVAVAGASGVNLTAYGILGGDGSLCVTLINKEHGPAARTASVALRVGPGFGAGQEMLLAAPDGNVAAESGVTLGGALIRDDGSWAGNRTPLAAPGTAGLVVSDLLQGLALGLRQKQGRGQIVDRRCSRQRRKTSSNSHSGRTVGRKVAAMIVETPWLMSRAMLMPLERIRVGISSDRASQTHTPGPTAKKAMKP